MYEFTQASSAQHTRIANKGPKQVHTIPKRQILGFGAIFLEFCKVGVYATWWLPDGAFGTHTELQEHYNDIVHLL